MDVGLKFKQDQEFGQLIGYVDFDFASDLDKCGSMTRYIFTIARSSVSWRSTLQFTIALSTI